MRAWGGDPDDRWGGDDSYEERKLRQGREGDRRRSERKTQDGRKWTPEREKQGRWQEERSIKGGQQKRQTRSYDDREEERGTPRSMTSGQRVSKRNDQARKDAGKTGKAENQEGARKVAEERDDRYQAEARAETGRKPSAKDKPGAGCKRTTDTKNREEAREPPPPRLRKPMREGAPGSPSSSRSGAARRRGGDDRRITPATGADGFKGSGSDV